MSGNGETDGPSRTGLIPRHPLSLGEIIEGAIALYRATWRAAVPVVAVAYAPVAILSALAMADLEELDPRDPFAGLTAGDVTLFGVATIVGFLVGVLLSAAVTWLAIGRARGEPLGAGEAYRATSGAIGRLLLASFLLGLFAFGLVIVVVLGVALAGAADPLLGLLVAVVTVVPLLLGLLALSYLLVPVVILEDSQATAAISRAWELLRVRLWPTLGAVLVAGILFGIVGAIISSLFSAVAGIAGPAAFVIEAVGSTLAATVTIPLVAFVALLIHVDAVSRLEGPDEVRLPAPADALR